MDIHSYPHRRRARAISHDVVGVAAGEHLHVQADAGVEGDGFHDVAHQGAREVAADHAVFEAVGFTGAHAVRTA